MVNVVAILWVAFISVILSLPDNGRAGKTIAAVTVLLGLWYVLRERHRFAGPAWSATSLTAEGAGDAEVAPRR
jgi:hypothetical protein